MIAPYTDGGFQPAEVTPDLISDAYHYSHTFTNTSGSSRTIREIGFSTAPGYSNIARFTYTESDLSNLGIVPAGGTITVDVYQKLYPTQPYACTVTIDTSTFTNAANVHYNGVPFPNASITGISPAYGGKSWEFKCYTELQSEIDALQAYVCPMEVGVSITGRQYVKSPLPAGTLFIKNLTTRAKVSYANCFIQSIDIEPMYLGSGLLGQWFNITVVQSAYADA
jgi:hypothetical protein